MTVYRYAYAFTPRVMPLWESQKEEEKEKRKKKREKNATQLRLRQSCRKKPPSHATLAQVKEKKKGEKKNPILPACYSDRNASVRKKKKRPHNVREL